MRKRKSRLEAAKERTERALEQTNHKIQELGLYSGEIYETITKLQSLFDQIANVPNEQLRSYKKIKEMSLNWKTQVERIESDFNKVVATNTSARAVGLGAGMAVLTIGPKAAMGVASTFGVASTGTAISTLSGAAATNAALAWLGGGALVAGGGGMVAGEAFLSLMGPVGWTIAGVALAGSGIMFWKANADKNVLDDIFIDISMRDIKSYELARVEMNERILHIQNENEKLNDAMVQIRAFGLDYDAMTEEQQIKLGGYINLMRSSTQLLINPILGLSPKYSDIDLSRYISEVGMYASVDLCRRNKNLVILLANMLYDIDLNAKKITLLGKSLKENDTLLESAGVSKNDFDEEIIKTVEDCLRYQKIH